MSFNVKFYSEDEFDSVLTLTVESLSEASKKIAEFEQSGSKIVDFVSVEEADGSDTWYEVLESLELETASQEISEELTQAYSDSMDDLLSESGWFEELLIMESAELTELSEQMKKKVDSKGKVTRVRSKRVRSRQATRTTGMSKSKLKRRAKKSSRSRKRNPGGVKKAAKKRKKTMRRRRQMGIK